MDGEQKVWAWLVGCIAIILVVLMGCITYYRIEQDKLPLLLVEKGINPAVARCTDVSWSITSNYIICNKVLGNAGLSREEAEKIAEDLR